MNVSWFSLFALLMIYRMSHYTKLCPPFCGLEWKRLPELFKMSTDTEYLAFSDHFPTCYSCQWLAIMLIMPNWSVCSCRSQGWLQEGLLSCK